MTALPGRRRDRQRALSKGARPLRFSLAICVVVIVGAWLVVDRGPTLPASYHEVELTVLGMH